MNRIRLFIFLGAVATLCACQDSVFTIGKDLTNAQSTLIMTDSFSVKMASVLIDSLETSRKLTDNRLLVGSYETPGVGMLNVYSYFNISANSKMRDLFLDDDYIRDSITLRMSYSDFYIGDTTSVMQLDVYQLTKELELNEHSELGNYLYNTSSFPHEASPLASYRFTPCVNRDDSIEFRLDNRVIDQLMQFENDYFQLTATERANTFSAYMKGFVLKCSSGDAVVSFKNDTAGVKMVLYTHKVELTKDVYTYRLYPDSETSYIQADATRTGGFELLEKQIEDIPSYSTDNRTLIQGLSGVVTHLTFPNLSELLLFDDRVLVKGLLMLAPSDDNDNRFLPKELNLFLTNRYNALGSALTASTSQGTVAVALTLNEDDPDNRYYEADITDYLISVLQTNITDSYGLIVSIPDADLRSTAKTLILNDDSFKMSKRPRLKLYFLKYE
ncbi:MAG: DUF4270 domain-containing protein [Bacteroidales bacterium]|jgi:hypothetical protein|nr:DUF4270 domain-containing protein [Bacteroidales bacterium]